MLSRGSIVIPRCGSITVYLSLEFNQDEEISKVLSVLSKAVTPGGKGLHLTQVQSKRFLMMRYLLMHPLAPPKQLLPRRNQQVKVRGES